MENKVYILVDEYTYDNEVQPTELDVFDTQELAEKALAERWEWYKKESYISQIFDCDGNLDQDEFDKDYDTLEVSHDSVEVYISAKDTTLSLNIIEKEVKTA